MNLPTFDDIAGGLRFFVRLPTLLRYRVNSQEAHAALRARLENRESHFLDLAKRAIYDNPVSPYFKLLKLAGCELGDLQKLVHDDGVEAALSALYRRGVYLTAAEAKGRQPVVRGSARFELKPAQLAKPGVAAALISESGGSGGARSRVLIDLELDRVRSQDMFLDFEARGGLGWVRALWGVPGTASLRRVINYTLCGEPPARWFSLVDPGKEDLHPRYLWSARALRLGGLLAGIALPRQIHVPLHDPRPIALWMSETLRLGRVPLLYTYASCAVRVCQTALESGISLKGSQFIVGGEPATLSRLAVITRSGATAHVQCGSVETDTLGRGCMSPRQADDLHLLHDRLAVIQPGSFSLPTLPTNALLVTSIYLPMAKLILLNVSLGDQAEIEPRNCGCPVEKLGWPTHLHSIRSFEKLTAGGMTFVHADLIRALEEILPARFGGGPTDYQLVDGETKDGKLSVRLRVHPRLGPIDGGAIREQFLSAVGEASGADRVKSVVWRDAGLPIIERMEPKVTAGGKILHVHLERGGERTE